MRLLLRAAFCVALFGWGALLSCAALVRAQTAAAEAKGGGSVVTGRVTGDDGKGLAGVAVVALQQDVETRARPAARGRTDSEGRYTLTGVPAGRYTLTPVAPAFVVLDKVTSWPSGKSVTVGQDETIEGVDFSLARGGVITGRVTNAEGKPLVAQLVRIAPADEQTGIRPRFMGQPGADRTDDRGIYRIYGLPAGRYRVVAGEDTESGIAAMGTGRSFYRKTFYPGVTEESKAEIVEVRAGGEAIDIDIKLGSPVKTYKAAGRVVEAETGKPVAGVSILIGSLAKDSQTPTGSFSGAGAPTDARGEFQMVNILPGRYALFASPEGEGEWYGEPTHFEVTDADVGGLELKARRGASISGVVEIEGDMSRAALARISNLYIGAHPAGGYDNGLPFYSVGRVGADRRFHIKGLKPGRLNLALDGRPQGKGFMLMRVERGGVELKEGIEVGQSEQVTGVRVVVGYGNGVIQGQVKIENGVLPPDARVFVAARRLTGEASPHQGQSFQHVDVRGRFTLENLMPGEYEVTMQAFAQGGRVRHELKQRVTVGAAGETNVNFVLDLGASKDGNKP
ncbi:MAG TPA: carboxypeptidase regulatory-like domain-containing protein [Pyrinomonadaceae bacterium]